MGEVATAVLIQFLVLGLWQFGFRQLGFNLQPVAAYLADATVLIFALSLSMSVWWAKQQRITLGSFSGTILVQGLGWGIILAFLMHGISNILAQYFLKVYQPQTISELLQGQGGFLLVALLAFTCVFGPVVEELFFRGFVQTALTNSYGSWSGIVLSGIMFGVYHFDAVRFLPLALAGIILGYVRQSSGSVWTAIVTHITWNTITAFLLLV